MNKEYACCDHRDMVFVNTLPDTVVYQDFWFNIYLPGVSFDSKNLKQAFASAAG
jgi:hypothetical protein